MKRTLIGILSMGLLAFAIAAYGQPSQHHAAKSAKTRTVTAAGSVCTDPSRCPAGCAHGTAMSATASSAQIHAKAGICNGTDPAHCPASCRHAAAGQTAERVASR
jgi:hypothetical protein